MTDQQSYDAADRAWRRDRLMARIIEWAFPLVAIGIMVIAVLATEF